MLAGIRWLEREVSRPGAKGAVVVPTINHIRRSAFAGAMGPEIASAAYKSRSLTLPTPDGPSVVLILSTSGLRVPSEITAVLLAWPSDAAIQASGDLPQRSILALAWSPADMEQWTTKLGFAELGTQCLSAGLEHSVVRAALESLTSRVNLATGLTHPSDHAAYVDLLYLLRKAGEVLDPAFISRTLVGLGWQLEDAGEAGDIATRFARGSRIKHTPGRWAEDIVDQWRQRAAHSSSAMG